MTSNPDYPFKQISGPPRELYCEFVLSVLDLHTFNVFDGPRWIGQLHINPADQYAQFVPSGGETVHPTVETHVNWRRWARWADTHTRPRDSQPHAF
jgi:hypothetical protein